MRDSLRKRDTGEPGNPGQFGTTGRSTSGLVLQPPPATISHADHDGSNVIIAVRHDTADDPLGPLPSRPDSLVGADIDYEFDEYQHTLRLTVRRADGGIIEIGGRGVSGHMTDAELAWLNRYQRRVGKAAYALLNETKNETVRRAILDAAAGER